MQISNRHLQDEGGEHSRDGWANERGGPLNRLFSRVGMLEAHISYAGYLRQQARRAVLPGASSSALSKTRRSNCQKGIEISTVTLPNHVFRSEQAVRRTY